MALRAVLANLGAENPPSGNILSFLAITAIVVIGCPKPLPPECCC
jgi:hypothetical protein